jgi:uncharacterized protein
MLVRVAEIPEEGLVVEGVEAFPRPFQDPSWMLDDLALAVEKDDEAVFVRGRFRARIPQECGRCLEPYTATVEPEVDTRFVPSPARRGEELALGADDLETDVYEKGILDLTALLETEATLLLPMKPLCREDCQGLCPVCGGNRNLTACHCEVRATDPRWAQLAAWAARPSHE